MNDAGRDSQGRRRRALVTGASSGIGQAFAERLARDGYDLIVVARRRDRLEALARRLSPESSVSVEVLSADLSRDDGIAMVESRIARAPELDLLVNNAGFGAYMPFVELPPERAAELIRLQVLAVTLLSRAALPAMVARGSGAVINVSSRLGPLRGDRRERAPPARGIARWGGVETLRLDARLRSFPVIR